MLVNEMLMKISRFFKAEVVDNSSIIKVHQVDIVGDLCQMFMGRCTIAQGYDWRTKQNCTFISPLYTNLCDAVFMASKLSPEKVYIKEHRFDDGINKILVLNDRFLYTSSGYKYTPNSPFVPSVSDYCSEWMITGKA